MTTARILDPDVLAGLGGLSVRVQTVVEGVQAGLHRSPFRGSSSEFAEHKEYSSGDELRTIDWKLYGRTDRYFVKQFHEETNLAAWMIVDLSASMNFGGPLTKYDYAAVLAGSLTYLLAGQVDAAGLSLARADKPALFPARTGPVHMAHLIDALQEGVPQGEADLARATDMVGEKMRRRGLVYLLSDLLVDREALLAAINRLRSRKAEVVVLHVLTPEELTFPYREAARFADPETDAELPADPETVREAYTRALREFIDGWRDACLERGVRYHLVDTSRPPERVLREALGRA